jgi:hypothetical protein
VQLVLVLLEKLVFKEQLVFKDLQVFKGKLELVLLVFKDLPVLHRVPLV